MSLDRTKKYRVGEVVFHWNGRYWLNVPNQCGLSEVILVQLNPVEVEEPIKWSFDTEYIRADVHAAEVERLNKALEQLADRSSAAVVTLEKGDAYQGLHKMKYEAGKEAIVGGVYGTGEVWGLAEECPELFAWLKENR